MPLATAEQGVSAAGYSPTLMIRSSGASNDTVFCAPGAGAPVTCFLPFAEAFGDATNIVGLQSRGLDGLRAPHSTVEAAADECLEAVRKVAPDGPYRLLGHSFGGWVVFEIARRLRELGAQVAPILLLDADPPSLNDAVPGRYARARVLLKFIQILERWAGRALGLHAQDFEGPDEEKQLRAVLRAMQTANLLPKSATTALLGNQIRVFERNLNTVYRPRMPLSGEAYLLQTTDVDPDDEDFIAPEEAVARWRSFAPRLRVVAAAGNHVTMLERPAVDAVAQLARRVWERG
jgi:thioesterase domain-containing protein